MTKPRKIEAIEELARTMVGDGKTPDVFFVTDRGVVVAVTRSFDLAYAGWKALRDRSPRAECALENRNFGVIASVEPDSDEEGGKLYVRDDSLMFLKR